MAEGSPDNDPTAATRFPLYRALNGSGHFYRIEGPGRFTEIQVVGSRSMVHCIRDAAYPEQVRIQEMISCANGLYIPMDGEDWERRYLSI